MQSLTSLNASMNLLVAMSLMSPRDILGAPEWMHEEDAEFVDHLDYP